ncbi:hypothetical protein D3C80_987440 [compost metagenome]
MHVDIVVEEPVHGPVVGAELGIGELIFQPVAVVGGADQPIPGAEQAVEDVPVGPTEQRRTEGQGVEIHFADRLDVLVLLARPHQDAARPRTAANPGELRPVHDPVAAHEPPLGFARRAGVEGLHRGAWIDVPPHDGDPVVGLPADGLGGSALHPFGAAGVYVDAVQGLDPVGLPGGHQHMVRFARQQVDDIGQVPAVAHPPPLILEHGHGVLGVRVDRQDSSRDQLHVSAPDAAGSRRGATRGDQMLGRHAQQKPLVVGPLQRLDVDLAQLHPAPRPFRIGRVQNVDHAARRVRRAQLREHADARARRRQRHPPRPGLGEEVGQRMRRGRPRSGSRPRR